MVEMIALSPVTVRQEIVAACGKGIENDPMLDDFASIGALMTNGDLCLRYLQQLNDGLFEAGKRDKTIETNLFMVKKGFFGASETVLKACDDPRYAGKKGFKVVKHHKLLTSVLDSYEAAAGFNTGKIPVDQADDAPAPDDRGMPKGAPTLSRFVSPGDFRKYLFHYCYHWKDTGVGSKHGEFTHRLQWFIILEHAKTGFLKHKPLDLFAACARDRWRYATDKRLGVWDIIVDKNDGGEKTFRRPEYLHRFLCDAAESGHKSHKKIWLLAQLIRGRSDKRALDAEVREASGKSPGEVDVPDDAVKRGEMFLEVKHPNASSTWDKTEGSIFWKKRG